MEPLASQYVITLTAVACATGETLVKEQQTVATGAYVAAYHGRRKEAIPDPFRGETT